MNADELRANLIILGFKKIVRHNSIIFVYKNIMEIYIAFSGNEIMYCELSSFTYDNKAKINEAIIPILLNFIEEHS